MEGKIVITGAVHREKNVCLRIVVLAGGFAGLLQFVCFIYPPPVRVLGLIRTIILFADHQKCTRTERSQLHLTPCMDGLLPVGRHLRGQQSVTHL